MVLFSTAKTAKFYDQQNFLLIRYKNCMTCLTSDLWDRDRCKVDKPSQRQCGPQDTDAHNCHDQPGTQLWGRGIGGGRRGGGEGEGREGKKYIRKETIK